MVGLCVQPYNHCTYLLFVSRMGTNSKKVWEYGHMGTHCKKVSKKCQAWDLLRPMGSSSSRLSSSSKRKGQSNVVNQHFYYIHDTLYTLYSIAQRFIKQCCHPAFLFNNVIYSAAQHTEQHCNSWTCTCCLYFTSTTKYCHSKYCRTKYCPTQSHANRSIVAQSNVAHSIATQSCVVQSIITQRSCQWRLIREQWKELKSQR